MSLKVRKAVIAAMLVPSLLLAASDVCEKTSDVNRVCKKEFVCKEGQSEPGCQRVLACVE